MVYFKQVLSKLLAAAQMWVRMTTVVSPVPERAMSFKSSQALRHISSWTNTLFCFIRWWPRFILRRHSSQSIFKCMKYNTLASKHWEHKIPHLAHLARVAAQMCALCNQSVQIFPQGSAASGCSNILSGSMVTSWDVAFLLIMLDLWISNSKCPIWSNQGVQS